MQWYANGHNYYQLIAITGMSLPTSRFCITPTSDLSSNASLFIIIKPCKSHDYGTVDSHVCMTL